MSKGTIIVCGHGPGISEAVARRFGKEGYAVALVARNADRVTAAAEALTKEGITARAFPTDLGQLDMVRGMIRDVKKALGPTTVIHWNALSFGASDLTKDAVESLDAVLHVSVHGMIAATQEALPDLEAAKGSLLVTGGGFCFYDPKVDGFAVQVGAMGVAIGKAAQHKATGLLHVALAPRGVYVGEVVVMGSVKGTPWDQGQATLEASTVAQRFWDLHTSRAEATTNVS
ncbi:MAG: SDR family NAD(P)-dependent oxidoreductase [Deltaproteobacteria bacterium]|nr:SDR family NAD(P)-dependent oxidoreductase [Deltaproteobacteria bacterium]